MGQAKVLCKVLENNGLPSDILWLSYVILAFRELRRLLEFEGSLY